MKATMKILTGGLMVVALLMASCEKSEAETELPIEKSQEEGFTSKTENSDSQIDARSEVLSPLLHRRYDASMSKEEASALFRIAVAKFEKENGQTNKTASFIHFDVETRTSNHAHSQTDGNVWARVNFLTDNGHKNLPWFRLNNEGDDRENGSWDFYHFGTHVSSISWIEAENAVLALQGTDGWHIRYFDVRLYSWDQYSNASGSTRILSNPEIWLDNSTSSGWDFYNTGNVGYGRLNFD